MSIEKILGMFSYSFVTDAILVGTLVSLCAALLGVILVLKQYSLIGHGLGDVGFASLSLSLALGLPPLFVSMPIIIAASFIIMSISQKNNINGDVAVGVTATASLAIGIIITSISKGFNIDVSGYMFGSILAMDKIDVYLSIVLAIIVIGMYILFYNRLFLITCDEEFAKASGINVTIYQFLISFLTAITVAIGMRIMGTLLISSLIIFPAITARKLVKSFKFMVILSAIISIICFFLGMLASFVLDLPTGACIVIVNIIVIIISKIT